ncbi:hypothetical protein EGR_02608 [Echinococcus granulosus]|uniref:Uncharacterized protein n=1 Tax=Echinococcus granulosus TaxID=6210 RepID=W6UNZ3_ECHGR|nr:hypothetical protein EGR_02608 [Echinococcus granulosus]EUB62476.1 hypothetical protein EGR_02608 [Echinococcus granulosus]
MLSLTSEKVNPTQVGDRGLKIQLPNDFDLLHLDAVGAHDNQEARALVLDRVTSLLIMRRLLTFNSHLLHFWQSENNKPKKSSESYIRYAV